MTSYTRLIMLGFLIGMSFLSADADTAPPCQIPRLDGITTDGNPVDWGTRGFQVNILPDKEGRLLPKCDFYPRFRLAWDEQGLLVLAEVDDDMLDEKTPESSIWDRDSVEVYIGPQPGTKRWGRLAVHPGISEGQAVPGQWFTDFSKLPRKSHVSAQVASQKTATGYRIEGRIPWTVLRRAPKENDEIALQVIVNDTDGDGGRFQAAWYPSTRTADDSTQMQVVRLARKTCAPENARVFARYDGKGRTWVRTVGTDAFVAQPLQVRNERHLLAKGTLERQGDWAVAELVFPMPSPGHTYGSLRVHAGGRKLAVPALPNADVERGKALLITEIAVKTSVFSGPSFPSFAPKDPLALENFIGSYRLETEFYDARYNRVENAGTPGRYGAVVHIIPESGTPLTRFVSLYRAPDSYDPFKWWFFTPSFTNPYPANLGLHPLVLEQESGALDLLGRQQLITLWDSDWTNASLVAGLSERDIQLGPANCANNAWARDRQWWVGLKRKLYGTEQAFNRPFICPRPIESTPAPVLREGTPAEAGMHDDVVNTLDTLLAEWAEKSGEPFAVCLARKGVVFFHKAYGLRDGQPMTVTTKSWMASISKLVSGVAMMTLVDQGFTGLETPVADYLPPLRAAKVETPLTLRSLYTHTNGLNLGILLPLHYMDHWGDEMHDFDERVAEFYPYMSIGKTHGYNGAGYALGGKVMETVTGEALPQLIKKHLLEPLGMNHTNVTDASAHTFSIPMDMAILGQMLLNKGAYGDKRFFTEAAYEQMLPKPLQNYTSIKNDIEWGIGTMWMRPAGLSKNTFGHGAASSALFAVDPENQLVLCTTRNTGGPLFHEYQPKFLDVIAKGISR